MLILTSQVLPSFIKSRNIRGYKTTFKQQLINLIITGKRSPTLRPTFKV